MQHRQLQQHFQIKARSASLWCSYESNAGDGGRGSLLLSPSCHSPARLEGVKRKYDLLLRFPAFPPPLLLCLLHPTFLMCPNYKKFLLWSEMCGGKNKDERGRVKRNHFSLKYKKWSYCPSSCKNFLLFCSQAVGTQ